MAVNENKWGLLYCPRNGWREGKRWLKIVAPAAYRLRLCAE